MARSQEGGGRVTAIDLWDECAMLHIAADLNREVIPTESFDRNSGIGASLVYDVVHDPMHAYCVLRGIVDPLEDNDLLEAGRFMEPAIAAWFAHKKGVTVRGNGALVVKHPTESWMYATPDRFVYDAADRLIGGLEAKNWNEFRKREIEDGDYPERLFYQTQWQMHVTGLRVVWPAVVFGGNKPRFDIEITYDAPFCADLEAVCRAFWFGNVLKGVPPEVTGSDSSRAYLKARYRKVEPVLRAPEDPEAARSLAHIFLAASANAKTYESIKAEAQNKLCALIGDAEGIALDDDGWTATWRARADGVRVFNLRTKKES